MNQSERLVLFIQQMFRFSEQMAEERAKRGHVTYPEGVSINPSAWPPCPLDCEHELSVETTAQRVNRDH